MGTWFKNPFLNACGKIYEWIVIFFSNFQSIFVFILRIMCGHEFLLAGWAKLTDPEKTVAFFESLNISFSIANTYIIDGLEFAGGILLMIGLASRLFAISLSIVMLAAFGATHKHIFDGLNVFYEPFFFIKEEPFPYLIICLIVLVYGPGKIALDALIKKRLLSRF